MKIAVINQKGGCGKSNIVNNLAVALNRKGLRVTIIDTDQQESTMDWFENRKKHIENVDDLLTVDFSSVEEMEEKLEKTYQNTDVIIIDGTPSINALSHFCAITADLIILPMQPKSRDLQSTVKFINGLPDVNPCVLWSRFRSPLPNHGKRVVAAIEASGVDVFETRIHERTVYDDTYDSGHGVHELWDKKASAEMEALCNEVLIKVGMEARV